MAVLDTNNASVYFRTQRIENKMNFEDCSQESTSVESLGTETQDVECNTSSTSPKKILLDGDLVTDIGTFQCDMCDGFYCNKDSLDRHLVAVHKFQQCEICYMLFALETTLLCHVQTHKREYCESSFASRRHLEKHYLEEHASQTSLKRVTAEKRKLSKGSPDKSNSNSVPSNGTSSHKTFILCEICSKWFPSEDSLKTHRLKNHAQTCKHCSENFESKKLLDQHYLENHLTKVVICKFCSEPSADQAAMDQHLETSHKFECPECHEIFPIKHSLAVHMFRNHRLKCEYCHVGFSTKKKLNQHCFTFHKNEYKRPDFYTCREYKCDICNDHFKNKSQLNHHLTIHLTTRQKWLQSEMSPKNFVENHSQSYISKEILKNEAQLKLNLLQSQMCPKPKLHQNEIRPKKLVENHHKCHICSETLKNKAQLNRHLNTKHKLFQCEMCPKSFVQPGLLKIHKYVKHSSNAIFRCETCDLSFMTQTAFKEHNDEQHRLSADDNDHIDESANSFEIGVYECNECKAVFETFHELEYHKKIHIPSLEELPMQSGMEIDEMQLHQCDICKAVFHFFDDLEKHSKDHIKEEINVL